MKLVKPTLVLYVLLFCYCHVDARAVRRSCGRYLADRISEICQARGGHKQLITMTTTTSTTGTPRYQRHRRLKRGVVEECCRQSCTDTTLIQYCAESDQTSSSAAVEEEPTPEHMLPSSSSEERKPSLVVSLPTEKSVIEKPFTTRFPFNAVPRFEKGTLRPEFTKINVKYVGGLRKQYAERN